ncbi:MAG: hypothetical protein ABIJ46_00015 [bacterium]
MELLDLKGLASNVRPTKWRLLPGLLPFAVGAVFYASSVIKLLPEAARRPAFFVGFLVAALLALSVYWLPSIRPPAGVERWRIALPPVTFVAGGFLFYILLSSGWMRFVAVTAIMLTLLIYIMRLDAAETLVPGRDANSVVRLGRLLNLFAIFFAAVFMFGAGRFVSLSEVLTAAVFGVMLAAINYESLQQSGADRTLTVRATAALTALGMETYIGLSFLPTPYLANAAVLTVVCFTVGRSGVRILSGDIGTRGLKFGLVAASLLIILVMATARWL